MYLCYWTKYICGELVDFVHMQFIMVNFLLIFTFTSSLDLDAYVAIYNVKVFFQSFSHFIDDVCVLAGGKLDVVEFIHSTSNM